MSENQEQPGDVQVQSDGTIAGVVGEGEVGSVRIVYILYLVGLVVPLVSLVGLVMAYVKKGKAPEWAQTHYRFQIRTFWIYFLYVVIGVITAFFLIGYFVILFALVWYIVRMVKALSNLQPGVPHENPGSWMFG